MLDSDFRRHPLTGYIKDHASSRSDSEMYKEVMAALRAYNHMNMLILFLANIKLGREVKWPAGFYLQNDRNIARAGVWG